MFVVIYNIAGTLLFDFVRRVTTLRDLKNHVFVRLCVILFGLFVCSSTAQLPDRTFSSTTPKANDTWPLPPWFPDEIDDDDDDDDNGEPEDEDDLIIITSTQSTTTHRAQPLTQSTTQAIFPSLPPDDFEYDHEYEFDSDTEDGMPPPPIDRSTPAPTLPDVILITPEAESSQTDEDIQWVSHKVTQTWS